MPDPIHPALEQAYAALCQAKAALEAAGVGARAEGAAKPVHIRDAAIAMRVEQHALRQRAYRNKGAIRGKAFIMDGVWHFAADYVEARRRHF